MKNEINSVEKFTSIALDYLKNLGDELRGGKLGLVRLESVRKHHRHSIVTLSAKLEHPDDPEEPLQRYFWEIL